MKITKPSDLELQILSFLWEKGPSTAREVLEAIPDGKKRAYTSILSVMQVMEKKGFLGFRQVDSQELCQRNEYSHRSVRLECGSAIRPRPPEVGEERTR